MRKVLQRVGDQATVRTLDLKKELNHKGRFRVSIFGSARTKFGDKDYQQVYNLAKLIAEAGGDIITGGGPGMMEAANAGHFAGDTTEKLESIGLVIKLPWENKGNKYLELQQRFKQFSKRLDTFLVLSDVMVVTNGGIGTMLELYYMWQNLQVFLVDYKPIILMGEMWEKLIDWMKETALKDGLISPEDFDYIYVARTEKEAMKIIKEFQKLKKKEGKLRQIPCHGSKCVMIKHSTTKKVMKKKPAKKTVVKKTTSARKKTVKKIQVKILAKKSLKKKVRK